MSETSSTEPAAAPAAEPPRERLPGWAKQLLIGAALALVGAVVARAVGVIPSPFGGSHPAPTGSVAIGETLRNQTLAMFEAKATSPRAGDQLGLTLAVQRTSENTPAHGCRIVWSFLDAKGPTPVSDPALVEQTARDVDGDPTACQGAAQIWVPLGAGLATFDDVLVRVELFDGNTRLGLPAVTSDIPLG